MVSGRKLEFDREQTLQRAMELFWERGYERTGMNDLLEHLSIGRQSLYNTFGNKRQLFLQALDLYGQRVTSKVVDDLERPGSPKARIVEVLTNLESWVTGDSAWGCLYCNTMAEFGAVDPEAAAIINRYYARQEEAYYRAILAAQDSGEISKELDARGVAQMFINTARGLSLLSRQATDKADVAKRVVHQARTLIDA